MTNNLFDLSGRIAVVTGAAAGLGQAMAIGLAGCGADIAGVDINDERLADTITQVTALGRKGLAIHCDVGSPDEITHLFERVDEHFGRVDILINNAGIGSHCRPEDLTLEEWNRIMNIDITAYFLCAQQAGRRMIKQGTGGSIINISSIAGSTSLGRGNFVYGVAKGAVNQFTRDLAVEWAKHNIRVNAILPCQVRTAGWQSMIDDPQHRSDAVIERVLVGIPMNRFAIAEDFVGPAVFLASEAAAMVTGTLLPVDGGNLALNGGGSHTW